MKKIISFILISFVLTGCMFRPHKMDIEQGNVITANEVSKLHAGMSEYQVKEVMGNPVLTNIFTPNRVEYIYTLKEGYGAMQVKRVSCVFQNGRLREVVRS